MPQNAGTSVIKKKNLRSANCSPQVWKGDTKKIALRVELYDEKAAGNSPRIADRRCGGREWIRTTEVDDNRFTVCPLWPLGNSPI